MSIIFAILMFSVLIFVHELGHFMTAKLFGVQVNEFSMFMGPAIWKKQIGETLYAIRLIPFGGYCAMEGEDEDTDNPRSFQKAAWWKRIIILAAGSVMNLLTGVIIYMCLFLPTETVTVPVAHSFTDCCIFNTAEGIHEGLKRVLEDPSILDAYRQRLPERKAFFDKANALRAILELFE
jgi:regulator of sigma E protease